MYDYSFQGMLNQIASYSTFGLVYLIGGGFLFGAVSSYYWGVQKAIVLGGVAILILFLFLSFQETGLTAQLISHYLTFFKGILYTFVGLVVGSILVHWLFNVNQ